MKKKVLASVLAMTLIFCSVANVAFAADEEESEKETIVEEISEEGDDAEPDATAKNEEEVYEPETYEGTPASGECGDDLTWSLDEDGTLTISGTGDMYFDSYYYAPWDYHEVKKVIIEKGVTSIASNAFSECIYLTDITIPESVTEINPYAFYNCSSLAEIVIPNGVSTIFWYAFCGCSNLKKITIPESVTYIDDGVFFGCSSLFDVTLPSKLKCISNRLFYECTSLKEIVIPDQVTAIASTAFYGCSSLEEIFIPKSVASIGVKAFTGTPWAEKAVDEDGFLVVNNILVECQSEAEAVSVTEGITSIEVQAFYGKDSLKSVEIPDSVENIGECAFAYCDSLAEVSIPNSITAIQYGVFKDCTSLTDVEIPDSVESIADYAFYNTGLTSSVVPESVTYIGERALGYVASEEDEYGYSSPVPVEGFTIYGYAGSAAETYANENLFNFVAIEESATGLRIVPEKTDEIYVRGSGTGAVIYCTGEFSKFVSVEMDGVLVDPSNYTVAEGSTVLTFASSYLDTLALGRHVVTLNYIDDSISTFLTIIEKSGSNAGNASGLSGAGTSNGSAENANAGNGTVQTGDSANIALWLILGIGAVVVCVLASRSRKKSARR